MEPNNESTRATGAQHRDAATDFPPGGASARVDPPELKCPRCGAEAEEDGGWLWCVGRYGCGYGCTL